MDQKKSDNEKMPDFEELTDRVIAEPTDSPFLVMKTNLDPENSTEENPYFKEGKQTNTKAFRDYFEGEE